MEIKQRVTKQMALDLHPNEGEYGVYTSYYILGEDIDAVEEILNKNDNSIDRRLTRKLRNKGYVVRAKVGTITPRTERAKEKPLNKRMKELQSTISKILRGTEIGDRTSRLVTQHLEENPTHECHYFMIGLYTRSQEITTHDVEAEAADYVKEKLGVEADNRIKVLETGDKSRWKARTLPVKFVIGKPATIA